MAIYGIGDKRNVQESARHLSVNRASSGNGIEVNIYTSGVRELVGVYLSDTEVSSLILELKRLINSDCQNPVSGLSSKIRLVDTEFRDYYDGGEGD